MVSSKAIVVALFVAAVMLIAVVVWIGWIAWSCRNPVIRRESFDQKRSGKTVWLLWFQGWQNAPRVALDVKQSWIKWNPEWSVQAISEADITTLIPGVMGGLPQGISAAARSDVVRLNLLSTHGGVWADSTMLCMRHLDDWIYPAIEPSGFWMYHGGKDEKGPASWFIVSQRGSYIIDRWRDACEDYWKGRDEPHDYFWMDSLFHGLVSTDREFAEQWSRVPYVSCEKLGQAHSLAGRCAGVDVDVQNILAKNPPYALKLSRHDDDFAYESNAAAAIRVALGDFGVETIQLPPPSNYVRPFQSQTVVVVADCGYTNDLLKIKDACIERRFDLMVYDKCNFCQGLPEGVYGRPLRNQGREQQTFVQFVITYYDTLPENIVLIPTPLDKHDRERRFFGLLDNPNSTGCAGNISDSEYEFTLDDYTPEYPILPASVRPFGKWFDAFVGKWDDSAPGPCWNGLMRTTRERIHSHPIEFYIKINEEVTRENHNSPEAGHFMERCMESVF